MFLSCFKDSQRLDSSIIFHHPRVHDLIEIEPLLKYVLKGPPHHVTCDVYREKILLLPVLLRFHSSELTRDRFEDRLRKRK